MTDVCGKPEEKQVMLASRLGLGGIVQIWCKGEGLRQSLAGFMRTKNGNPVKPETGNNVQYCLLNDGNEDVDEVLIGWREDAAEINCHGGTSCARAVMAMLKNAGFSEVKPLYWWRGEVAMKRCDSFTAETLLYLEKAVTSLQASVISKGFFIFQKIKTLLDSKDASAIAEYFKSLMENFPLSEFILKTHKVALVGAPNSGKSTMFNNLLAKDRVLVSDIAGTTRDSVSHHADIGGFDVELIDTAGLLKGAKGADAEAVKRAHDILAKADLRIMLLDSSREISDEDKACIKACEGLETMYVFNKSDLPAKISPDKIESCGIGDVSCNISALSLDTPAVLIDKISSILWKNSGYSLKALENDLIFTKNQYNAVIPALKLLEREDFQQITETLAYFEISS